MARCRTRRSRTRTIAAVPTTINDRSDWTPERIDLLARALLPVAFPGRPGALPRSRCRPREGRGCQVPAGGVITGPSLDRLGPRALAFGAEASGHHQNSVCPPKSLNSPG